MRGKSPDIRGLSRFGAKASAFNQETRRRTSGSAPYADEGGADGFMLIATYTPGCFEEFVDMVVPELQRRGRLRTEYTGHTLRDHLLEQ